MRSNNRPHGHTAPGTRLTTYGDTEPETTGSLDVVVAADDRAGRADDVAAAWQKEYGRVQSYERTMRKTCRMINPKEN
jgi:hypothetical protein